MKLTFVFLLSVLMNSAYSQTTGDSHATFITCEDPSTKIAYTVKISFLQTMDMAMAVSQQTAYETHSALLGTKRADQRFEDVSTNVKFEVSPKMLFKITSIVKIYDFQEMTTITENPRNVWKLEKRSFSAPGMDPLPEPEYSAPIECEVGKI